VESEEVVLIGIKVLEEESQIFNDHVGVIVGAEVPVEV
jgi:hypothetical protein